MSDNYYSEEHETDVEPVEFEATPGFGGSKIGHDDAETSLSVRPHMDGDVTLVATAKDEDGVGVGGVTIRIPESAREEAAEKLLPDEE